MDSIAADVDRALAEFGTDPRRGLTSQQAARNREQYGANELTPPLRRPLWRLYVDKFHDPTITILAICAGLALLTGVYKGATTGDWLGILEAVAIFIAILIATGVGFWLEYKADQAFELLKAESENVPVKVTRDGEFHTMRANDLVVGDLVHLESGDKILADGLVVMSSSLRVDQSSWNGEPIPAEKSREEDAVLVSGTDVLEGNAVMIVTAVGDRSMRGEIAQSLSTTERDRTPLERKLDALAEIINVAGTAAAALIFAATFGAGLLRGELGGRIQPIGEYVLLIVAPIVLAGVIGYVTLTEDGRRNRVRTILYGWLTVFATGLMVLLVWGTPLAGPHGALDAFLNNAFSPILGYFMLAVTIIVVAVPEGLPMAVTISLALSMQKIRRDNNLVRKMVATETLGSTTVICSDKTGTLTMNRMSVERIYVHGRLHERGNDGHAVDLSGHPALELIALNAAVNSTAHIEQKGGAVKFVGNQTECALLQWLRDQGIAYEQVRELVPFNQRIEFTSARKMMSTVVSRDGSELMLTKGAAERIIGLCGAIEVGEGRVEPLESHRSELEGWLSDMTHESMRPLALAYRRLEPGSGASEGGLTLLALIGISDPVRPDVPGAIATCKRAGIQVKMVTGDHETTARVIAERIGIWGEDSVVRTGEQFQAMSDDEIKAIAPRLHVLARFNPLQKERLVRLLQELGEVVAVTGDGTNDAPALRKADVGISMGLRGTDIAKEASDVVLVDDNFGSIVHAVHWGRALYENVQKFLQFQLAVNSSALMIAFFSPLLVMLVELLHERGIHLLPNADFHELPLTILQLLWVNLIMDTLAALALSLEPRREEVMLEPPKRRDESFLTRAMTENILFMGGYRVLVILFMQATGWYLGAEEALAGSVMFTTYVFMQVFNMFTARAVKPDRSAFAGLAQSRNFWAVLGLIVVVQFLLTTFGGATFSTAPLPPWVWLRVIAVGASSLLLGEIFRMLRRGSLLPRVASSGAEGSPAS